MGMDAQLMSGKLKEVLKILDANNIRLASASSSPFDPKSPLAND